MYCRKCGVLLPDDSEFCTDCGNKVVRTVSKEVPAAIENADIQENSVDYNEPKENSVDVSAVVSDAGCSDAEAHFAKENSKKENAASSFIKENKVLAIVIALIVVIAAVMLIFNGTRCKDPGCDEKAEYGKYCGYHACMFPGCNAHRDSGEQYCGIHLKMTAPKPEKDLVISSKIISSNSVCSYAEGKITNHGDTTYTFVQVKGSFTDMYGKVLDTDWTYAVGSEGLAPGESATFRVSVDKNYSIRDCKFSILDYDY